MPKSCSAINCTRRSIKGNGISFFRFPLKHPALLRQWIQAMRRADWNPNQHSALCSTHFAQDSYQLRPGASHLLLRSDAVPSIFDFPEDSEMTFSKGVQTTNELTRKSVRTSSKKAMLARLVQHEHGYSINGGSKPKSKLLKRYSNNRSASVSVPGDASINSAFVDAETTASALTSSDNMSIHSSLPANYDSGSSATTGELKGLAQASTNASTEVIEQVLEALEQDSPEGSQLFRSETGISYISSQEIPMDSMDRPVIRYTTKVVADDKVLDCSLKEFKLRRRVRALQQDIRRRNVKVRKVTEQMYELRKEKNAAEAAVTTVQHNFGGMAQELFNNQMRNGAVAKGAERYSQAIKEFALVLYGHSPPAYEYLSGIFRLPHLSCIKAYSSSIKIPDDVVLLDFYQDMGMAEVIESDLLHIATDSCCIEDMT